MLIKTTLFSAALLILLMPVRAQELLAHVTVNATQVSSQVDKKVFQTLQTSLSSFLNNRKWTEDTYQASEKIACNFLLVISQSSDDGTYTGSITVQAARPVYNSSYVTPLINFRDEAITFKYVEFQPIEFNENRVAGTDPLASNLTACFAFYAYVILGLDYDSFVLRGGDPYFQKAENIINNAPDARNISGWRSFDGRRNRYWLMENLTSSKYAVIHDAMYAYYRQGMDHMYENEDDARAAILNCISQLNTLNNDQFNSMVIPFFFQGKSAELSKVFKKAPPEQKQKLLDMVTRLDASNLNTYKQELK